MLNKLEMFKSGIHFGHKPRYWNPETAPYVFGKHPDLDLHIIDLDKTVVMFDKALQFVRKTAQSKGKVLFVGTKRNAQELVKSYADFVEMPYVTNRWLGGMLTNFKTIKKSVDALRDMEQQFESQSFEGYTKKERLTFERRLQKLRANLSGIKNMKALPDAIFVVDVKHESIAIKEANKLGIPVIGVVDTNSSPQGVEYIIPGNDDAVSAINYYVKNVAEIIKIEKEKLALVAKKEEEEKLAKAPKVTKVVKDTKNVNDESAEVDQVTDGASKKMVKRVVKAKADTTASKAKKVVKRKTASDADADADAVVQKPKAAKSAEDKVVKKAKSATKAASTKTADKKPVKKETKAKKQQ